MKSIKTRKFNRKTQILPELIPQEIPGFKKHNKPNTSWVLSFNQTKSDEWFYEFTEKITNSIGKNYLPVMRMSDGEYKFLLGEKYPVLIGNSFIDFIKTSLIVTKHKLFNYKKFRAATLPGVSSGNYSVEEITNQKIKIIEDIKKIAENGILALHLTYPLKPFQEQYHYSLKKWFEKNQIIVNENNYYPFYFVYALLRGSIKKKLFIDKTVLVLHGAKGNKKKQIINSLIKEGVKQVLWHEISSNRSMFDKINIQKKYYEADLALIGAGVGKFNILSQLEPLKIPCIDAGFVFEVWANEENKWKRPIMVPDWEWDENKILFIKRK